jgi:hypothetical protein
MPAVTLELERTREAVAVSGVNARGVLRGKLAAPLGQTLGGNGGQRPPSLLDCRDQDIGPEQ